MNSTITIRIIKEEVLTFKTWAKNYAKTQRHEFNEEAKYKAALRREWNRLLNETGGSITCEQQADDEEVEEALDDYDCHDDDNLDAEEQAMEEAAQ